MRLPPGAVTSGPTRAALAVLGGATSVRQVGVVCGWQSPSHAHENLRKARELGLVTWEPGLNGTLRPTVTITLHLPETCLASSATRGDPML
jgi:hypothetical protein